MTNITHAQRTCSILVAAIAAGANDPQIGTWNTYEANVGGREETLFFSDGRSADGIALDTSTVDGFPGWQTSGNAQTGWNVDGEGNSQPKGWLIDPLAASDYMWVNEHDDEPVTVTLTIEGLDPSLSYDVGVGGMRQTEGSGRFAEYLINGEHTTDEIDSRNYSSYHDGWHEATLLNWEGVTLDEADELTLTINVGAGDNAFLNAMQVSAVPEPGSLALLGFGGLTLLSRRRRSA